MPQNNAIILIEVSKEFTEYIAPVVLRLQTLYPDHIFTGSASSITIEGKSKVAIETIRQDASHLLYKEKIYTDTLKIRTAMMKQLFE